MHALERHSKPNRDSTIHNDACNTKTRKTSTIETKAQTKQEKTEDALALEQVDEFRDELLRVLVRAKHIVAARDDARHLERGLRGDGGVGVGVGVDGCGVFCKTTETKVSWSW